MPPRKISAGQQASLLPVESPARRRRARSTAPREGWVQFICSRCGDPSKALRGTQREQALLCRSCLGKGKDRRPRELNELSGKEWANMSRSVEQYPDTRSEKQRLHGASFPQSLARAQIEIYTRVHQTVLDPFVGVGTTIDACVEANRHGIGVDVNPEFIDIAQEDLHRAGATPQLYDLLVGDARELDQLLPPDSVDFVLTSPPYGALLRQVKRAFAYKWQEHTTIRPIPNPVPYSEHPADIGNLEYDEFMVAIADVLRQTYKAQKSDSYAAWVIKDFRALKADVPYVNCHSHFITEAEAAGFTLWDLRIWDQTKFRPLVCLGYPSRNFYLNIGHSYLVILRKL